MVITSDELKESNILKLLLIVRFACVTLNVGYPIHHISLAKRFEYPLGLFIVVMDILSSVVLQ
jgi:hypothetical protein